jgi:hypothetical protein
MHWNDSKGIHVATSDLIVQRFLEMAKGIFVTRVHASGSAAGYAANLSSAIIIELSLKLVTLFQ